MEQLKRYLVTDSSSGTKAFVSTFSLVTKLSYADEAVWDASTNVD